MVGFVLVGALLGAVLLIWLRGKSDGVRMLLDGLAVLAYMGFFVVAASSVARTIWDDTVFMTQVHEVLQSPIFLASGAYLGPYGLALLVRQLMDKRS
ncbi:transposase [Paenibacillus albus]|uniref:Transposase n=1 Tax=Paenibacillus albus TaxID=2495582 RepID=A0A3Q8XAU4_9BACL|nr:transposase [Paenibacillus albus]AZN42803.1 transposase [Paenibacillus albus]